MSRQAHRLCGVSVLSGLSLGLGAVLHLATIAAGDEPSKPTPGLKKDKEGWQTLFDGKTLAGWKTAQFSGAGKVQVKDGAVILNKGDLMTGITYTRGDLPTTDYEVALEGKRLVGSDFFCTTTFPVGKSFCSLVVGGWGGEVVGLSSLDSMDASSNETSTTKQFKLNEWYKIRIRVVKDKIQAWIDDEKLVDVDTEGKRISIRLECGPCKPLGIATWCTAGAVRNIRIRSVKATGK